MSVSNGSPEVLTVTGLTFTSPAFAGPAEWPKESATIPAGVTRDLRVPLPQPACGNVSEDGEASGKPQVELRFLLPDAAVGTAQIAPGDPIDSLKRILTEDCAGVAIAHVVGLVGTGIRVEGNGTSSVAVLTVGATPTGTRAATTILRARPTVLLESPEGDGWPLDLRIEGGDPVSTFELRIIPNRCDAHAVAEDKVGTRSPVDATDADGVERRFPLPLADGVKEQLLTFVARHCGFGD